MLSQDYVYWRERFHVLKYLIERTYGDYEIDLIMKEFLSGKKHPIKNHDNYEHYLQERQLQYVRRNSSLFSCKKIKDESLCPIEFGLCDLIKKKPLYL